jgi:hypothetical protein
MTQDKPNKRTCFEHAVYEAILMVVLTLFIIKHIYSTKKDANLNDSHSQTSTTT